ncbi:MAG: discoidin domain-containing protein [Planctomycetota bacterium]|nr:discoidin domain-containing protein [Planctomycetota bacterium]
MRDLIRKAGAFWLVALLAAVGCDVGAVYDDNNRSPVAAISQRKSWRAYGDLRNPQHALDGKWETVAVSNRNDYDNAVLAFDLGKPCLFNMVVIEHGPNERGFCGRVAVLTSMDGVHYSDQKIGSGTRAVTTLLLDSPVLARYVQLKVIVPGTRPWSVSEVYLQ